VAAVSLYFSRMKSLQVSLGNRSYPIHIGSGVLDDSSLFQKAITGKQVLVVSNDTVEPLYGASLLKTLSPFCQVDILVLPDGEQYKQLETINQIYDHLLRNKYHRTATLVALGGGVIGDMCGFAAATYQRGVNFIQIPTTLLAQVDSSVGGKTGVNHPLGKNMIGAFYQPKAVMIDTRVLLTLPEREFSAGLAEVIKYGLIHDADFFSWLEKNISFLVSRDEVAVTYAIEKSCRIKSEIVSADEREEGIRAHLNFGHTFGHAIETHLGYGDWLHGEAVASGMMIATQVSALKGWLTGAEVEKVRNLLIQANLPIAPPEKMKNADFFEKMQLDKKVLTGNIRYILLKNIGSAVIADGVEREIVEKAISSCRSCVS